MDICGIRHVAKLSEWQQRICEWRSSGQPVKKWCEDHHISVKSYYRWKRLCIAQATNQAVENSVAGKLMRIEPAALESAERHSAQPQNIIIRCGDVSVELSSGISTDQIVQPVKVLNNA